MSKRIPTYLLFGWMLLCLLSCDKRSQLAYKIALVACQDTKDMITSHANNVIPIVGKMIMDYAISEELKKGMICDCLNPSVQEYLVTNYQEAELENMLLDKPKRIKAIQKALIQHSSSIYQCYEEKGLKGVKLMKSFIDKTIKAFK